MFLDRLKYSAHSHDPPRTLYSHRGNGGVPQLFPFWNSAPSAHHRLPRSFFSCTYKLPLAQLLSFDIHASDGGCRGCRGCTPVFSSNLELPKSNLFLFTLFRTLLRFFALSQESTLFFSSDSELFGKNTGGGVGSQLLWRALRFAECGHESPATSSGFPHTHPLESPRRISNRACSQRNEAIA